MDSYGVSKPYDELEEFYSLNAWRTGDQTLPLKGPREDSNPLQQSGW